MQLGRDAGRVQRVAHVVDRVIGAQGEGARLGIDLDLGRVEAVRAAHSTPKA